MTQQPESEKTTIMLGLLSAVERDTFLVNRRILATATDRVTLVLNWEEGLDR